MKPALPAGDDEGDDLDWLGEEPILEDSELFEEVRVALTMPSTLLQGYLVRDA